MRTARAALRTETKPLFHEAPEMISFFHDGTSITNPYESECGRFEVQPAHYGFVEAETTVTIHDDGRRGRALVKTLDTGNQIRLTTEDGLSVPANAKEAWIELLDPTHGLWERHPVPLAGTLAAYVKTLTHLTEIELDATLQRLETDSGCGEACVKVLDKANEFIALAYDVREEILAAAARQLSIFYYG